MRTLLGTTCISRNSLPLALLSSLAHCFLFIDSPAAKLTAQLCQNLHIGKQQTCLADNNAQAVGNDAGLTAELWQKRILRLGLG